MIPTATTAAAAWSVAEREAMGSALQLAVQGVRGANPLVGAVILDPSGRTIGEGHHRGAGTLHAETDAIAEARRRGEEPAGATMVVSLEPCNHIGRTGACTEAIIEAGIKQLIYAVHDTSHTAAGGAERLRAADVQVRTGLMEAEATALNNRWFDAVTAGRPFTTLHLAQTLDSQLAAADGTSQWISGPESRRDSHQLRRRIDAILVGTGTVLADNPRLTARTADDEPAAEQPLRVAMGQRPVPETAAMRGSDGRFVQLETHDPRDAGGQLHVAGIRHLMIEGGAKIAAAFLKERLVDELIIYLAPSLLGRGIATLDDLGVGTLNQAHHWRWDQVGGAAVPLGNDLRLHLEPKPPETDRKSPCSPE
ncbi:bifunctional diaminohydroxyphosphoribosylaminopyrimidine deaminase/5-amino-6-(5-phosphoribosylamino)uracil reductase RibD [Arthrobacter castelli]|uniref:bifunctional diaminohydroxyphosphoribosylaminopyrimidine deaminase/5-amino-6-(5-phosphoribosylamino)uracil reductase RibD n=1 Tax=Arthrobacter castelli TaxID=271431 RepID=UPI0003FA3535|nr:bifunctional diaminohydroxyphosphoribosylaminopyrimidine deaminase/5-amino-6-(5-phosphoribosylamino)uracil reductase RibD [Arthrobacter castelli]